MMRGPEQAIGDTGPADHPAAAVVVADTQQAGRGDDPEQDPQAGKRQFEDLARPGGGRVFDKERNDRRSPSAAAEQSGTRRPCGCRGPTPARPSNTARLTMRMLADM